MAAAQKHDKREQPKQLEQHKRAVLDSLIEEQLLHLLGKPENLFRVQVKQVWEDHYRVNVFVGPDVVSAKVGQSFFLVADSDGNIINSTPKITKQY